jgi:serine/threonine protein phosphatase PrpC
MVCIETGWVSLTKYGEELCGDKVEIINGDDAVTMVLADGLGSGVKANILSTLTSKILSTMIASGLKIDDAVETIAHTLPVCSQRLIAYSTFSALKVNNMGEASLIQFDNPEAIYIHDAQVVGYPMKELNIYGKNIKETSFKLVENDMLILLSDGVVHAGIGHIYNLGWQYSNVCDFVQQNYKSNLTAKEMAALLSGACRQLYIDKPGDDTTVAVLRIRRREPVNLLIGPPKNPSDAENMVNEFFSSEGRKVICGGTTSQIAADILHEELVTTTEYVDPSVPPVATLKGIDLVTEGVLTISKATAYAAAYSDPDGAETEIDNKQDGASLLAAMLINKSTDINFFVGTAINPAHQNPDFPAALAFKPKLVQKLAAILKKLGKTVNIKYF